MRKKNIMLNDTEELKSFVSAASQCDFDINVVYQHAYVDAKSIMGIISLGLSKIFTVEYSGRNHQFEEVLCQYAVAS